LNPVYPGILVFSERAWRGGGYPQWITNPSQQNALDEFAQFESRLLDHHHQWFRNNPFPYTRQSGITWKLYGPYPNKGDLSKSFLPESKTFNEQKTKPSQQAIGGTVVLRHWFSPLVKAVLNNPEDSATWYATSKIWRDAAGYQDFWVGFNNLSRSPATDAPPDGKWDNKGSAVWVNGTLLEPPRWKRGGQSGDMEIPLQDEGYEYRTPTRIYLNKGWNQVLIKVPVGTFKGPNWHNPVKWMFTFIAID
jgi:hypothetical protein